MADSRRYAVNSQLDLEQILLEAQNRWLRPNEVCEILRNYQKFCLTPDPPYKPPGGSLFLFDRKALRYFRKDGHRWRKKKDGKTVREAHEKLKAGSVDVLHCYYAHGEENENFQRRSYWMLEGELEHIVLVHYREVKEERIYRRIEHTNLSKFSFLFALEYEEFAEGSRSGASRPSSADTGTQNVFVGNKNASPASSVQANPAALTAQASFASSPSTADWNGQVHSSPEYEGDESGEDVGVSPLSETMPYSRLQITSLPSNDGIGKDISGGTGIITESFSTGTNNELPNLFGMNQLFLGNSVPNELDPTNCLSPEHAVMREFSVKETARPPFHESNFSHCADPFGWSEIQNASTRQDSGDNHRTLFKHTTSGDVTGSVLNILQSLQKSDHDPGVKAFPEPLQEFLKEQRFVQEQAGQGDAVALRSMSIERQKFPDIGHVDQGSFHYYDHVASKYQISDESCMAPGSCLQTGGIKSEPADSSKDALDVSRYTDNDMGLKKLDSFSRWMSKEIGADCEDTLMASDSANYWNTLNAESGEKEVSSLSGHMQLDVDLLGPSLSQEQLFSIVDFSPDWAYSGVNTKVLISGVFLAGVKNPRDVKWGCMFGELEVSAEILGNNVLRCQAPTHSPGRVPFYVTCSNRLACSEVREFEYQKKPSLLLPAVVKCDPEDETVLQVRLAKMLILGPERKCLGCSVENSQKCILKKSILSLRSDDKTDWNVIEKSIKDVNGNCINARELLMQKMLKDRLYEWLLCKSHDQGKGPNVWDDEGQGVIHLAAALGYEWALGPIVAAGVSPSFRDIRGRTALHWAASFGREETVVTLIRLGAAPGALEDPTSKFPGGLTAADLASSKGHKGIAGYLAEADLVTHLSSISLRESITDSVSATVAVEKAIEAVEKQSLLHTVDGEEDEVSLKESLAAVRKSAQAAARIQASFRMHSFKQRQFTESHTASVDTPHYIQNLVNARMSLRKGQSSVDEIAAVKIQQKYRGWKARKDFIKIRERIVKIQAHVRGHQVRKQYKKVVWSVGIVEKAILRWRRKGAGLRGFRADRSIENVGSAGQKNDEYDFLRLGRKQKVAGIEKALARVQSMVRYPEARDQYRRLMTNFQKTKIADDASAAGEVQSSRQNTDVIALRGPMTQ